MAPPEPRPTLLPGYPPGRALGRSFSAAIPPLYAVPVTSQVATYADVVRATGRSHDHGCQQSVLTCNEGIIQDTGASVFDRTPLVYSNPTMDRIHPNGPSSATILSYPATIEPPIDWIKIPQRIINPGRRCNSEPLEPICFSTNGRPGINLGDAFRENIMDLDGPDDPMLQGTPGVASCRLQVGFPRRPSTRATELNPLQVPWLPR